ncbi:DUF932 domain-containing protein [Desulfurivibrio sp. C05AmB]|uniref:DUF932 domain-containing protein n=1 Tax=Desulfurivibrio sp. C05AmB TaxID=3374371 RepID=UPI00376F0207
MIQEQSAQGTVPSVVEITRGILPKWLNSPLSSYEGSLKEIRNYVPKFERRPFAIAQSDNKFSLINKRLDTIVRKPFKDDPNFIPVGVVSREYALIPHLAVLDISEKAFAYHKINPEDVNAELKITEYGERMALSLYLPQQFSFDPGDGHPMDMRLECFNSVDGSTRFRALMGWFRLICSNGLVIGVTRSDFCRRHVGDLSLNDVGKVLYSGIREAENEKSNFEQWRKKHISPKDLMPWVENTLKKGWGYKAATRLYHIARTGHDAEISGPYKGNTPTTIKVEKGQKIPGAPAECRNLYDVGQALAWLAKERRDLQEQLAWREEISDLLKPLMH